MEVNSTLKASIFSLASVFLWITNNLGMAFYVLVGAYVVNFALHYNEKVEFIQRMTFYLLSACSTYYLQNTNDFMSIPMLRALIVGLAVHEILQVLTVIKEKLDVYKKSHPQQAAEIETLETVIEQAQTIVPVFMTKERDKL